MNKIPSINFTLNQTTRLNAIFVLLLGAVLFISNFYFELFVLEFVSIIFMVLGLVSFVLFTASFIRIYENSIEYRCGWLQECRNIKVTSIDNIVKGKNTYVINVKLSGKPIIVILHKLNYKDVPLFKVIMTNFQHDISLLNLK
ncbi:hypothetical protein MNBD_GAMMA22-1057 [hydrothermal vent metagenome]|uniref:Uncharacterized protein n=1 Tax=hydrothermal vent metagenome TaxID=652676 RepID=A0A3B1B0W8_9ZZZZ